MLADFSKLSHPTTDACIQSLDSSIDPAAIHNCTYPIYEVILLHRTSYAQGKRYGIENEAIIGLCFLPLGIGNAGAHHSLTRRNIPQTVPPAPILQLVPRYQVGFLTKLSSNTNADVEYGIPKTVSVPPSSVFLSPSRSSLRL